LTSRENSYSFDSESQSANTFKNKHTEVITMWSVALMQIGGCVGYIVVIGDIFAPLATYWLGHHVSKPAVVFADAIFVILPLTVFVRRLASFRYTAALSVCVVATCALLIICNGIYVGLLVGSPDDKRGKESMFVVLVC
jgi:amino acid permease